jgi:hypothetical protein
MTMKRLFLLPLLTLALLAAPGEVKTTIKLAWDFDPSSSPTDTGTALYVRTNLPAGMTATDPMPATNAFKPTMSLPDRTNWVKVVEFAAGVSNCTISATNLPGWSSGYRGPYFFSVTATNYVGESDFSNVVWMQPPPAGHKNVRGEVTK